MNNKRIEEILSAAFGEHQGDLGHLTDAERTELATGQLIKQGLGSLKDVPEHQLSNERLREAIVQNMTDGQRREFEAGLVISQGLASLKDVPEHQLSNERLRNAILGSTARQQRRFAPWSFATVGVACLALALVAMQAMNRPEANRDLVVGNTGTENNDVPNATALQDNTASDPTGQSDVVRTNDIVSNARPTSASATAIETAPSEVLDAEYRRLMDGGPYSPIIMEMDFGPSSEVVMQPASMTVEREPVVVVDSATLTNNGAASAREVASYGDVVFGG